MAISIIVGLSVAIMMIVIMHLLYDKVEEENSVSGLKFNDYFRAIGTGVAVGGVNFLAPKVTRLLPAVILLVVMIVIFVMLTKWWHEEGWDLNGLIPFIILIALLIFPTMSAAAAVNRFISNQFLISLIKIIPLMLAIVAVGFAVIDFFHLRYTKMDKNDESAYRRHRLGATIAAIATGVALLCLIVFGFRNPQRVIAADELTPEEVAAEEELETGKEDKEEVILDALENLTVVKLSVEELERLTLEKYVNISQVFLDSSLSSKDKERTEKTGFSDALTFGFNSKDETEMFKELEEEILRNPVYGVTVANAIKDKTIGDKRIGDFNPWMDEMVK